MVLVRICEHASSLFYCASKSSDQISLASSEHFRKFTIGEQEQRASATFFWKIKIIGDFNNSPKNTISRDVFPSIRFW